MSALLEVVETRAVYVLVVVLLGIGLYGMFVRPNLIHKIVGLTIAQVAIFLFFIEGSVREGATAPVIDPALGSDAADYVNPLPHLLILTAVVVAAATLGGARGVAVVEFELRPPREGVTDVGEYGVGFGGFNGDGVGCGR